jgi:hypothetical protein
MTQRFGLSSGGVVGDKTSDETRHGERENGSANEEFHE